MNTSCQILTLRHGKGLNEFGNQSFVRRVYLSLVSAETDCSFSSREGNLLVLVWIGSKRQILAHSSSLLYHSICALII